MFFDVLEVFGFFGGFGGFWFFLRFWQFLRFLGFWGIGKNLNLRVLSFFFFQKVVFSSGRGKCFFLGGVFLCCFEKLFFCFGGFEF